MYCMACHPCWVFSQTPSSPSNIHKSPGIPKPQLATTCCWWLGLTVKSIQRTIQSSQWTGLRDRISLHSQWQLYLSLLRNVPSGCNLHGFPVMNSACLLQVYLGKWGPSREGDETIMSLVHTSLELWALWDKALDSLLILHDCERRGMRKTQNHK